MQVWHAGVFKKRKSTFVDARRRALAPALNTSTLAVSIAEPQENTVVFFTPEAFLKELYTLAMAHSHLVSLYHVFQSP
jgi:hypothetical protein